MADTALQAGLNYATVVRPRVDNLIAAFPDASSISELQQLLSKTPATVLLRWSHPDKVSRFLDLVGLCAVCSVETLDDFQRWVITTAAVTKLRAIHGIGPKSIDYLRMLSGHAAVPMDRHLFRFVAFAGVCTKNYEIAQRAFTDGCTMAGLDTRDAEHQLWILMQSTQND